MLSVMLGAALLERQMELGETTSYEAWVMRYGSLSLFSDGHESADDAFEHPHSCGWDTDKIEVVRVKSIRQRVTHNV